MIVFGLLALVTVGAHAKDPCCIPPQWESPSGILEGYFLPGSDTVGEVEGTDRVAFDFPNRRLAANLSLVTNNETPIVTNLILDYSKGLMYQTRQGSCTSTNLSGDFPPHCIPPSATFRGTSYFGAGNNKLPFDTWVFAYNGIPVFITVTQKDCIPISETLTGAISPGTNVTGVAAVTFTGLTMGFRNPGVFDPPVNCQHINITTSIGGSGSVGSFVGRMRRELV